MQRFNRATVFLFAFYLMAGLLGCLSSNGEPTSERLSSRAHKLVIARNLHRMADIYLSQNRLGDAERVLHQILRLDFDLGPDEAVALKQDVYCRLAQIAEGKGLAEEALKLVDTGISLGTAPTLFLANLHHLRGGLLEFMGRTEEALRAYATGVSVGKAALEAQLSKTEK